MSVPRVWNLECMNSPLDCFSIVKVCSSVWFLTPCPYISSTYSRNTFLSVTFHLPEALRNAGFLSFICIWMYVSSALKIFRKGMYVSTSPVAGLTITCCQTPIRVSFVDLIAWPWALSCVLAENAPANTNSTNNDNIDNFS